MNTPVLLFNRSTKISHKDKRNAADHETEKTVLESMHKIPLESKITGKILSVVLVMCEKL